MGCCAARKAQPGPVADQADAMSRYSEAESLFEALAPTVEGHHPVRLVRMSWLLRQRGLVLERRQGLPDEAFVPAGELRAVWEAGGRGGCDKVAPIIAISFCWDALDHPDPQGLQLDLVIDALEKQRIKYSEPNGSFRGFSEMGVFWDWLSLLQGNPVKAEAVKRAALQEGKAEEEAQEAADDAKLTLAEKSAFRHALYQTMDLWHAHKATTVFLLTQHPRERGSARESGYEQSGWTTFERCSFEQIRKASRIDAKWDAVVDIGDRTGARRASVGWPVGPDQFDMLIEERPFTNGSDREAVKTLFRRMSHAQLGTVTKLDLEGMPPPTPEQMVGFAGCLRLCARLEWLDLRNCKIGDGGARALTKALPMLPALRALGLDGNALGAEGARALAKALPSTPRLRTLNLYSNAVGDEGAGALAAALPSAHGLQKLWLSCNAVGDEGARALAEALPLAPGLRRLYLGDNAVGVVAQAAVERAAQETGCQVLGL